MVHITIVAEEDAYMCDACRFHFRDRRDAEACERWCNLNKTCSEEITLRSIERTQKVA